MNIRRKCEFFTQEFYHFFREMDHSMKIQTQEVKGNNFFQAIDLAFHHYSTKILYCKAEFLFIL